MGLIKLPWCYLVEKNPPVARDLWVCKLDKRPPNWSNKYGLKLINIKFNSMTDYQQWNWRGSLIWKKIVKTSVKDTGIMLQADEILFTQMILTTHSRTLDLKTVLMHPLGLMPWSISGPDGSLRKKTLNFHCPICVRESGEHWFR